ncbi:MAG: hypothetical protein JW995_15490, partial [Melioribacteraceae bacterium]|nr:hypothetical protein [Melioribacteraceae bacterium]
MRISYIKDFRKGDRVKYLFPNPKIKGRDFIFGTVSRVSRASLEIRSDEFKMNLLQKHLDNIVY